MMERLYVDTMTETKSYETIAANVAAVREHMRQAALAAEAGNDDLFFHLISPPRLPGPSP